ncbi:MAG TPA: FAD-dependent oxidoreductase, partial [Terriglobales bacterium]|nr:FAD-dependent oxidoreductase [Terriglobales bacterium]
SKYGLTFIDNAQLWPGIECTALNVAATDFRALADLPEGAALQHIFRELQAYFPLDPDDLLYAHIETNRNDELFVNEIGSERWRPGPTTGLPSLFLAGDYCRTFIDVVTVEGAVVSALQAVRALQEQALQDYGDRLRGTTLLAPVTIVEPEAYPQWTMAAAAALLAPYAAAAKVWSWLEETVASDRAPARDAASLLQDGLNAALMPWQIGAELWTAVWSACMDAWTAKPGGR